ncbi:MAG: hypothetical protein ACJAQ4_000148 [Cryomorphaceae bacterium]|jgi:hypothetical protein
MKKLLFACLLLTGFTFCSLSTKAQAQKYLNLGGIGTGLYAGLELPVGAKISVQPFAATDWDFNKFIIGGKGNYYFDDLFGVDSSWDIYGGANVGWRIEDGDDDGANWGLQVGGRWFWSDQWAINAEFGGGSTVLGGVGVTMKL